MRQTILSVAACLPFMGVCVIAVSFVASSQAAPIASDSFATTAGGSDYVLGSIRGQNPIVGASGFLGPWNCCTSAMHATYGGLTHHRTPGETFDGHLIPHPTIDWAVRTLRRPIDYTPVDGTYYMSTLLHKNDYTTTRDILVGLGNLEPNEEPVLSIDATYIGIIDGGIGFFSGPGAHITPLLTHSQMTIGETYFALLQYDYSTSGPDTVTATIFDGSSSQVAHQEFAGLDLDGSMTHFSVGTSEFGPMVIADEWRFGTELGDVMVPEPATAVSMLMAGVALLLPWRRWHRTHGGTTNSGMCFLSC